MPVQNSGGCWELDLFPRKNINESSDPLRVKGPGQSNLLIHQHLFGCILILVFETFLVESPSQILVVYYLPLRKPSKRAQSKLTFNAKAESAAVWGKPVSNSGVQ